MFHITLAIIKTEFSFQWIDLHARKPKEGEEDPVLVEEIEKARQNLGKYTRFSESFIISDAIFPLLFC